MPNSQLTRIPGIGPATARTLAESGFASVEAIAKAATGDLARVQGFGPVRAAAVITKAQSLVSSEVKPVASAAPEKVKKTEDKKKKKKKKDKGKSKKKKDKKKDNGKSKKEKGKKKTSKKKRKK